MSKGDERTRLSDTTCTVRQQAEAIMQTCEMHTLTMLVADL